jgi:hypothetical protein
MTDSSDEYHAPSRATMMATQNTPNALRLLLAQRRLYTVSKRWLGARWLGMALIVIAAPIVSLVWPDLAVVAGAVAGGWIFLARTTFIQLERRLAEQAAAVQEVFDFTVFGMESSGARSVTPSLEEIALLAGPEANLQANAKKQQLTDWYPLEASAPGLVAVAICQRANASYSDRLLESTARLWLGVMIVWSAGLVVASIALSLSFTHFLLGIVLPILPAFLDVWEYWRGIRRASKDRGDLASAIEAKLRNGAADLEGQDAMVWQSQLFEIRRAGPQVPNFVYRLKRKGNEAAMTTAARQLSGSSEGEES